MVTESKDAGNGPFGGFVVVTQVKEDGRLIHYYEWPDPAPVPAGDDADGAAGADADV
jgi:hypothetical protein